MNYRMRIYKRTWGGGNPNGGIIVRLRSALAEPRALKKSWVTKSKDVHMNAASK